MSSNKSSHSEVYGLVLIGGKSRRMGIDKSHLQYHTQPQYLHQANMLASLCNQTFLSIANDDKKNEYRFFKTITDLYPERGPIGAILSAFDFAPQKAWLTVACDLPHLDSITLKQLMEKRNPNKIATCFLNPESEHPEPLATIWEPAAFLLLKEELLNGKSSPRLVLQKHDTELLHLSDPKKIANVNTPGEKAIAENLLKKINKKNLNIAGIILAAGSSSRMSQPKQLLQYGGKSFIARLAEICSNLKLYKLVCLTGYLEIELIEELKEYSIEFIKNENHQAGLVTSLQKAITHLSKDRMIDAVIVMLTDQPLILASHYQELVSSAENNPETIIATSYGNTYGAPALFKSKHFKSILILDVNQSPKSLISKNLEDTLLIKCENAARDIDTDKDYQKLIEDDDTSN